jgi:hypothetical protein
LISAASERASTSGLRGSDAYGGRSVWRAVAAFVHRGCPIVAHAAVGFYPQFQIGPMGVQVQHGPKLLPL